MVLFLFLVQVLVLVKVLVIILILALVQVQALVLLLVQVQQSCWNSVTSSAEAAAAFALLGCVAAPWRRHLQGSEMKDWFYVNPMT